jgi:hypothetical protein
LVDLAPKAGMQAVFRVLFGEANLSFLHYDRHHDHTDTDIDTEVSRAWIPLHRQNIVLQSISMKSRIELLEDA